MACGYPTALRARARTSIHLKDCDWYGTTSIVVDDSRGTLYASNRGCLYAASLLEPVDILLRLTREVTAFFVFPTDLLRIVASYTTSKDSATSLRMVYSNAQLYKVIGVIPESGQPAWCTQQGDVFTVVEDGASAIVILVASAPPRHVSGSYWCPSIDARGRVHWVIPVSEDVKLLRQARPHDIPREYESWTLGDKSTSTEFAMNVSEGLVLFAGGSKSPPRLVATSTAGHVPLHMAKMMPTCDYVLPESVSSMYDGPLRFCWTIQCINTDGQVYSQEFNIEDKVEPHEQNALWTRHYPCDIARAPSFDTLVIFSTGTIRLLLLPAELREASMFPPPDSTPASNSLPWKRNRL